MSPALVAASMPKEAPARVLRMIVEVPGPAAAGDVAGTGLGKVITAGRIRRSETFMVPRVRPAVGLAGPASACVRSRAAGRAGERLGVRWDHDYLPPRSFLAPRKDVRSPRVGV